MAEIEDQLRRELHDRAESVRASSGLGERIEGQLHQRITRRRRASALVAVAVLALGTVVVQSELSHAGHRTNLHISRPTLTTPSTAPSATAFAAPLHVPSGGWALTAEPPASDAFASVWTGTALIVAFRPGGSIPSPSPATVRFASYDPSHDRWQALPDPPVAVVAPFTDSSTFVWTGSSVLVWGYEDAGPDTFSGHLRLQGYSPATRRWVQLADPPIESLIQAHPVWTGREMLVWGGNFNGQNVPAQGAAYDPTTNHWRPISASPLSTRENPMIVWTGHEMIVWGGFTANGEGSRPLTAADRVEGAAYSPTSDSWRILPPSGLPTLSLAAAVWTGQEMLIYSAPYGGAYSPTTNRWRHLRASPLTARDLPAWAWTGRQLIVWGGLQLVTGRQAVSDGAAYDPSTDRWAVLPSAPIGARHSATMAWTGMVAIVIGGYGPSQAGVSSEPAAAHAAAYRP